MFDHYSSSHSVLFCKRYMFRGYYLQVGQTVSFCLLQALLAHFFQPAVPLGYIQTL